MKLKQPRGLKQALFLAKYFDILLSLLMFGISMSIIINPIENGLPIFLLALNLSLVYEIGYKDIYKRKYHKIFYFCFASFVAAVIHVVYHIVSHGFPARMFPWD